MHHRPLICLLTVLGLVACQPKEQPVQLPYSATPGAQVASYRIAPHPLYNPQTMHTVLQPLASYLEQRIPGVQFELEASTDYQAYERKIRDRGPEFILPNPWQTLLAQKKGYNVMAMWGDAEDFRGLLIVRRDSNLRQVADLRGRVIAFPSPTAVAAAMMPQYWLHEQGLNVNKDVQSVYVGSQFSTLQHLLSGDSDVASTWPPPWRVFQQQFPQDAAKLKVMWETPPLLNNSVMARNDVPADLVMKVRHALLNMHEEPEGRRVLGLSSTTRFYAADDARYELVADFVKRFERDIRPVETRP